MRTILTTASIALCLLAACSGRPAATTTPGTIRAFVTIAPQAFFVRQIAGDRVRVDALVPPGQSAHTFEPSPKAIAKLSEANAYFRIGEPFEEQLVPKLAAMNPALRIVDTRAGIVLRPADNDGHGDAVHAGVMDPHIWLAPRLVKVQARTIARALAELDPAGRAVYEARLARFLAELDAEDAALARILAGARGSDIFVYHPFLGYFADAYGLRQVPIEIAGKEPSARAMADLIDRAKREGAKIIFVAPQFSEKSARSVAAAIGGRVERIDPYAADYFENLEAIATKIRDAVQTNPKIQIPNSK